MSSAVVDATQDAPPHPPARRAFGWGKAAWALIVAVIALAGSASSLLFAFLPQLKPDPRDSVAAQLSVFAIDPDVSLGDYVVRAYGSLAAAPPALRIPRGERSFPGDLVYVRTRVDGFKHRRVRLVASIYDAATQRRFPLGPGGTQSEAVLSARTVELDTPSTSTVQLFWIESLRGEPPAFVRIEMYDGARMLAVADSPVIRNNRAPLPVG
jgi:hypothetical protein